MDCRSTERRQWIIDNYNVVPDVHAQLLANQTKYSDAGSIIKNEYYIFRATNKVSGENEVIQCGMGAARDFLRLLKHKGLPLFNPLHGNGKAGGHGENYGENERGILIELWDPTAHQLFNAIMWIILIIDAKPDTPIFDIKEKVNKYKDRQPFDSQVKAVNTIIGKNFAGKTLTEKIDELRSNNNIRDNMCQFDRLIDIINNYTDKNGNRMELKVYF